MRKLTLALLTCLLLCSCSGYTEAECDRAWFILVPPRSYYQESLTYSQNEWEYLFKSLDTLDWVLSHDQIPDSPGETVRSCLVDGWEFPSYTENTYWEERNK